ARPLPFPVPLAFLVGVLVVLLGSVARAVALFQPAVRPYAWPVLELIDGAFGLFGATPPWPVAGEASGLAGLWLWVAECTLEFILAALLTRYGGLLYWALDRYFLGPFLLQPTDWLLDRLTASYSVMLRLALKARGLVLAASLALIGVTGLFLYYDVLG